MYLLLLSENLRGVHVLLLPHYDVRVVVIMGRGQRHDASSKAMYYVREAGSSKCIKFLEDA